MWVCCSCWQHGCLWLPEELCEPAECAGSVVMLLYGQAPPAPACVSE